MARVGLGEDTVFAGDFRIIRQIAEGGMGVVYLVEQISLKKKRALKILRAEFRTSEKSRKQFIEEAQIGGRIPSEHIVEVVAAGVEEASDTPWLVMEYLEGETLAELLRRTTRLPSRDVVEVFQQLAHGLGAAHRERIVHGDLKPANIFIARSRISGQRFVVKLLDLGLAKSFDSSTTGVTGDNLGSPGWMAPEQGMAGGKIKPSTDVWAMGLLAFRLLVGRDYWRSIGRGYLSLANEMQKQPIVPASVRAAEYGAEEHLPAGFDNWFLGCVNHDPGRRFRDADAAFSVFATLFSGPPEPVHQRFSVPLQPVTEAEADSPRAHELESSQKHLEFGTPAPPITLPPTSRWKKRLLMIGSAIGGAAICLLGYIHYASRSGALLVTSEPATNVQILVDNKRQPVDGTPATLKLEPGSYVLTVQREGYVPWNEQVEIVPGETTRRTITLEPLASDTGFRVVSEPAGLSVKLDGRALEGTTPLAVRSVMPGKHKIEVVYRDRLWTKDVLIEAGKMVDVRANEMELSPSERQAENSAQPLTQQAIMRVVAANRKQLNRCYNKALAHGASTTGIITMRISIDMSGHPTSTAIAEPEYAGTELASCMTDEIKKWKFPTSASDYETEFPIHLSTTR